MVPSTREFLQKILDYAGLFPPAKLPLEPAIRNYARYRHEAHNWMLARFIIPAAKIAELKPFMGELFGTGAPLEISALGRSGETKPAFIENLAKDFEDIGAFIAEFGGAVNVGVFETRLPADVATSGDADAVRAFVNEAEEVAGKSGLALTPFFEISLAGDWRSNARAVAEGIRAATADTPKADPWASHPGVKLRTGGLEASAFPTPEQVAAVIAICRDVRVPLKCTAGLHHPIRHFADSVNAKMHGFLNVWGAAILALARGIDEAAILKIVSDEDAGNFSFDSEGFSYGPHRATLGEMAAARTLITSFGSCSFDEPLEDLAALKLL